MERALVSMLHGFTINPGEEGAFHGPVWRPALRGIAHVGCHGRSGFSGVASGGFVAGAGASGDCAG